MGAYINPAEMSKEEFLIKFGSDVTKEYVEKFDYNNKEKTHLPVVLINNGFFKAAAIAYCEEERDVFLQPDSRPKSYFIVPIKDLLLESDLSDYLKKK